MEIKSLTKDKIKEYSQLTKKIISSTNYYTEHARNEEIKKFSKETLEQTLESENDLNIYAEKNNKLIAFFNGHYDCGTFWAGWIGIDEKYRNNIVAKKMITYVEKELKNKQVHKIWFDTLVNNTEAIKLVEKLGFKKNTRINNHWYKQDFYLWEKIL